VYSYLRIFESNIVRKTYYEPIKEGEPCRIRTNKDIKDVLQGEYIVKNYKIPPTKMVWSC
jgi:hypothetical protein